MGMTAAIFQKERNSGEQEIVIKLPGKVLLALNKIISPNVPSLTKRDIYHVFSNTSNHS